MLRLPLKCIRLALLNTGWGYSMFKHISLLASVLLALLPNVHANDQLADPTMPPGYQHPNNQQLDLNAVGHQQPSWILNTTLINSFQKLAIINGTQVSVGDEINGAKVINIDHQMVTLNYQGRVFPIVLHRSFISEIE